MGPESFVRGGPALTTFFFFLLVEEWGEDQNTTISGPSSARHLNGGRFAGVSMMAQN